MDEVKARSVAFREKLRNDPSFWLYTIKHHFHTGNGFAMAVNSQQFIVTFLVALGYFCEDCGTIACETLHIHNPIYKRMYGCCMADTDLWLVFALF